MFKIQKFKKENTEESALLIKRTFQKFNKEEYFEKSAVKRYLDFFDARKKSKEELLKKFSQCPIFYIAVENGKIIGIIRGTKNRIVNLFIDGKKHKTGIGKALVEKFEKEAEKQGSKIIKIRSSLYAVPFYQKMGYKKTTGIKNMAGLKFFPMKKILKK